MTSEAGLSEVLPSGAHTAIRTGDFVVKNSYLENIISLTFSPFSFYLLMSQWYFTEGVCCHQRNMSTHFTRFARPDEGYRRTLLDSHNPQVIAGKILLISVKNVFCYCVLITETLEKIENHKEGNKSNSQFTNTLTFSFILFYSFFFFWTLIFIHTTVHFHHLPPKLSPPKKCLFPK